MKVKFIEATNQGAGGINWGKFMVCRFDEDERRHRSVIDPGHALLASRWSEDSLMVVDLETGEAAFFRHGGLASADLHKHKIWVCPMYEPFLTWLYKQDVTDLDKLPAMVQLDAPSAMYGYRRTGSVPKEKV